MNEDAKQKTRERSNANLIPVKKGQILNPRGAGKGKTSRAILTWIGRQNAPKDLIEVMRKKFNMPSHKIDNETAILLYLTWMAEKGDVRAIELWLDRKYGKVTQSLDIETKNDGPLVAILMAPPSDSAKQIIDVPVEQLPANPDNGSYPTKDE